MFYLLDLSRCSLLTDVQNKIIQIRTRANITDCWIAFKYRCNIVIFMLVLLIYTISWNSKRFTIKVQLLDHTLVTLPQQMCLLRTFIASKTIIVSVVFYDNCYLSFDCFLQSLLCFYLFLIFCGLYFNRLTALFFLQFSFKIQTFS